MDPPLVLDATDTAGNSREFNGDGLFVGDFEE